MRGEKLTIQTQVSLYFFKIMQLAFSPENGDLGWGA